MALFRGWSGLQHTFEDNARTNQNSHEGSAGVFDTTSPLPVVNVVVEVGLSVEPAKQRIVEMLTALCWWTRGGCTPTPFSMGIPTILN